jgi:hypothetical protein
MNAWRPSSTSRCDSAGRRAIGFSIRTFFAPARIAASTMGTRMVGGVTMSTRSGCSRRIISAMSL